MVARVIQCSYKLINKKLKIVNIHVLNILPSTIIITTSNYAFTSFGSLFSFVLLKFPPVPRKVR